MSDQVIRIPNWDELQHYKKRSPSWIKLHLRIWDDYRFTDELAADERYLLIGLWALAAATGNAIRAERGYLSRKLVHEVTDEVIEKLLNLGLIEVGPRSVSGASNVLATCYQSASDVLAASASPRREEKRREEKRRVFSRVRASTPSVLHLILPRQPGAMTRRRQPTATTRPRQPSRWTRRPRKPRALTRRPGAMTRRRPPKLTRRRPRKLTRRSQRSCSV